jgi:hypothetical protein
VVLRRQDRLPTLALTQAACSRAPLTQDAIWRRVRRLDMTKSADTDGTFSRISLLGIRARIWLGARCRRFLRPGTFIVGLVAATYGISSILDAEKVPSESAWTFHHPLGVLLAATGIGALSGTLLVFLGYDRVLRKAEENDDLDKACRGLWHLAVHRLNVDMTKVGVHVWAVKGIKGIRYLERRSTFIIEARRRSAHVIWRKGKGVIGIAWADDEPLVANVAHLAERATSERLFSEISHRDRFGLTWRELRRSKHYRAILAVPLRHNARVLGCLSVDLQLDGYADQLDTLLQDDQFNNVLAVCEAVLAGKR